MVPKNSKKMGGLKGFFANASKSFITGGLFAKDQGTWVIQKLARVGFIVATTSIVTLFPLIFEISRESQMVEAEKLQVRQLRNDGYSDRQLQELGFCEASILRAPAVAMKSV